MLTCQAAVVLLAVIALAASEESAKPRHTNALARTLLQNARASLSRDRDATTRNRVIAMCLYGTNKDYAYGAIQNALLAQRDWPDWTLRIYHDHQIDASVLTVLRDLGVHLVPRQLGTGLTAANVTQLRDVSAGHRAMYWRFDVLADANVTRFIIRDTDAQLSRRDRLAVQEWVDSGRYMHVMRDHPDHSLPIMGGMWGAVEGLIPASMFGVDSEQDKGYNHDQQLLRDKVWPWARTLALVHDSYSCATEEMAGAEWRPFSVQRQSVHDFVGNKYERDTDYQGLKVPEACPPACRANATWVYC